MNISKTFLKAHRIKAMLTGQLMLITACSTSAPYMLMTEQVAIVKSSEGVPTLVRGAQSYLLAPQSQLYIRDAISTDKYTTVHIQFMDNSIVVVAPTSRLLIRDARSNGDGFMTELSQNEGSIEIKSLPEGETHRVVISAALATITTSTGNLWINHRFNGSQLDVVLTGDGEARIQNSHGSVILKERFDTTTVPSGAAPRSILPWTEERFRSIRQRRNRIPADNVE